jgi:hypothetical protein
MNTEAQIDARQIVIHLRGDIDSSVHSGHKYKSEWVQLVQQWCWTQNVSIKWCDI